MMETLKTTGDAMLLSQLQPGIGLLTLDMPGSSANVLTTALFSQLKETLELCLANRELLGLVLFSAKPNIFIAGADLKRIHATLDWPDEQIIQFCTEGREIMSRLSEMPFPTVAAIGGACVGGGLEVALWCDWRVAADDRKTILGLPEVKLGLVPGWAGTVRLPRLIGLEPALDLVTTGQTVDAATSLELGLVDAVVSRQQLLEQAVTLIGQVSMSDSRRRRGTLLGPVREVPQDLTVVRSRFQSQIQQNSINVFPFACQVVLNHMLDSARATHDQACESESLAMVEVYGSEPCRGLLNHYFLNEHNRKHPGRVDLKRARRQIRSVGIVGCGQMGRSIGEICLRSGHKLTGYDADTKAMRSAAEQWSVFSAHPFTLASGYHDFRDCDLVIEAVVEVPDIKIEVLKNIEGAVSAEAIVATNTSAIPLARLAAGLQRPQSFCGCHFCHPQLMQLVEIVAAKESAPDAVADVTKWVFQLGKTPVVVADHPGFVLNRLLAAMLDQAFRLYMSGCGIRQIDEAMRQFGFRGGPFEIVDVIGADVCWHAGRAMFENGVRCVTLSPILPRMVKRGWLGRKSLRGFYQYDSPAGSGRWDKDGIDQLLGSCIQNQHGREADSNAISDSLCAAMVLEAGRILDDGVVSAAEDIDVCAIHGLSFPAAVGGVLFWANRRGLSHVNSILRKLAVEDEKLTPIPRLEQLERQREPFY